MTPARQQRVDEILSRRQKSLTVLLDQVHKPHNLAAIIRTCDSTGIQYVHAVAPVEGIRPLNHTSQGAQKWVDVITHETIEAAGQALHKQGMTILAAHLSDRAVDFRSVDYTRPCAILMGTERDGVSDAALAQADEEITIPMLGMTRSLNVSVATAIILAEAQRQRAAAGLYQQTELTDAELLPRRFRWLHPQVAAYCDRHRLAYPALDEAGEIVEPVPQKVRGEG